MADTPSVSLSDFGIDQEDYWKKYAARHSGGASIKSPPPRSGWDVFMDSVHNAMSAAGNGLNAAFVRGNEAAREDDLARQYASDHNLPTSQAEQTIRENQSRRAADIKEARASREILSADEATHRSRAGNIGAKIADVAGGIVGDANPTYAIGGGGANALERIIGMGAVTGANDMAGQGDERMRGIRDRGDPIQTLEAVAGGAGLQGLGEAGGKIIHGLASAAKIRSGSNMPNFGDLLDTVKGLEGGGTEAHPNVSPKGAKGPMQVMDATARDPGFGIKPWNGKTEADRARVGRQYLAALNHEFNGDEAKVLAAYNAGPGRIKHVVDNYGDDWLHHLPDETQNYVVNGYSKLAEKQLNLKGPEGPDGVPTNGSVRPIPSEELARIMGQHAEQGPDELGQPEVVQNEMPPASIMEQTNDTLAPSQEPPLSEDDLNKTFFYRNMELSKKTRDSLPDELKPIYDKVDADHNLTRSEADALDAHLTGSDADMNDRGFVRSVVDNRWVTRDEGHEEAHQQWIDKNFPEGMEVQGYGHNIDEHGQPIDEQAVRAMEDQDSELAQARRAKDYQKASEVIDEMHDRISDLNYNIVEGNGRVSADAAEHMRSSINGQLHEYAANTPEHKKLLEIDDMLKEIIAYSGGKPRFYGPEASEKFLSGEPKTDAANNRFPVYDAPKPGKTLHEYTDQEWFNLAPAHQKKLIDEANDKLFYPERHPPAVSDTFGTSRPRGINPRSNKPLDEIKGPEGHEDKPALKQQKKLLLDKLGDAIDQGQPIRREAEEAIRAERARRITAAMKVRANKGGEAGFYAELATMKGEMGRPKIQSIRDWFSPAEIDQLYDVVKNSPMLEHYESITAQKALNKLLGADFGEIPTPGEIALLAKAMPSKASIWKRLLENEEGSLNLPDGALKSAAVNLAGLPRTLKASFDFSAPFRQGMFLVGRKEFWKAMPGMFKAFFKEGEFSKIQDEIYNRPTYHLMNKAGLETTRNNAGLADREEAFISQFAEKIPGVRHSERAYIAFLNKLRADVFDDFVRKGEASGIDFIHDPHYLKSAARFINSATGRGNLNAVTRDARVLTNVLFSPKLMKSRIDMLNPGFYVGLHPKVRIEAAKSGLIYAATVSAIAGLAAAAGASVDTDPRSSDFMKIKIGNTRLDITGGFQPYVRFYAQFLTGQQKSITDGAIKDIGWSPTQKIWKGEKQGPFKPTTRLDVLYRFLENKESPNMGEITKLLRGTDAVGQPIGSDANPISDGVAKAAGTKVNKAVNEVVGMFTPLIVQDTYQAYNDLGAKGLLTAIPNAGGVGVQTYTPKAKKAKVSGGDFGMSGKVSLKDFE